ncbi:DUF2059 domain-containing protein [Erythrobacter sp. JK5]|uniref:DUF2059 domain-containing protein n=1 Tax=Erythrobacter sp. JK5 TaxID=2829500 RepID=UPI001BABE043|nr:DUF2059 domain-containing protein [Erythrobacter sp. JK5]QUL37450.1 DUF2059 domain-containing protein [Erythrobacter sp. JK5]
MADRTMLLPIAAMALIAAPAVAAAQDHTGISAAAEAAEPDQPHGETFVFKTEEEQEIAAFEREMAEAFAIFGEILPAEPLTAEQEALLPLATQMSAAIVPEGALVEATEQTMAPMMQIMMAEEVSDARTRLAEVTGVESDELYLLEDAATQSALSVFDPNFAERTEKTNAILLSTITRLLAALEPAYREGLARALTLRFDKAEMSELLAFFATPVGEKFARESFLVHHDPQMLGVMEQMAPAMVEILPSLMEEFEAIEADIENVRTFSELSQAERAEVARLLEKPESELDALAPQADTEVLETEDGEPVI